MAIIYLDYASGNDGTGTGAWNAPYKTLNKSTTGLTGGDEVRAAVTAQSTLSGTLTFTNDSVSVNTTADLTSVLQAGDIIKHGAANEGWWIVASLTSSIITLKYKYYGTAGSGKTGYKIRPIAIAANDVSTVSGTSEASRLKISGGWTLASQTQTGITAISGNNDIFPFDCYAASYLEVSHYCFLAKRATVWVRSFKIGPYSYIHDIFWGGEEGWPKFRSRMENCIGACFNSYAIDLWGAIDPYIGDVSLRGKGHISLKDIWLYSCPIGIGCSGNHIYFDNLNIIGSNTFIDFVYAAQVYVKNSHFKTSVGTYAADDCAFPSNDTGNNSATFYNCTFEDITGALFGDYWNYQTDDMFRAYECEFINCNPSVSLLDYNCQTSPYSSVLFNNADGDSVRFFKYGGKITRQSDDSRSGKCLKFTPKLIFFPIREKIGTYKINETGTDITASVYIKKDGDFDGRVFGFCMANGRYSDIPQQVTVTTDYAQYSFTVDAADLTEDGYIDFYIDVFGSAGNIFVDDVSIN